MKAFAVLGVAASLLTASPALAVEPADFQARCEEREAQREERLVQIDARHDSMQGREATMLERLNALVDEAAAAGVDTSVLEADLASFDALTDELEADYQTWYAALESVEIDCATATKESVQAERAPVREAHVTLRENAQAVRDLMRESIRPHARELHQALEAAE